MFMSRKQAPMLGQFFENGPLASSVTPKSTSCPFLSMVVHAAGCAVTARWRCRARNTVWLNEFWHTSQNERPPAKAASACFRRPRAWTYSAARRWCQDFPRGTPYLACRISAMGSTFGPGAEMTPSSRSVLATWDGSLFAFSPNVDGASPRSCNAEQTESPGSGVLRARNFSTTSPLVKAAFGSTGASSDCSSGAWYLSHRL